MAERILELLTNLLKMGKEQFFLKTELIRSKVPIKPVLGLTGLGVLFMAVRPLLTSTNENTVASQTQIKTSGSQKDRSEASDEYDVVKTLQLMRDKEREIKRQQQL